MGANNVSNPQYNYQMPPQMPRQPQQPQQSMPRQPQQAIPRQPYYTQPRVTKNKFLTFVFACLPGAGQMYHGLMKKGISLMLLFFGIFGLSVMAYMGVLNVLLPVIWFYSFFDTVNRMNMTLNELKSLKDDYLIVGSGRFFGKPGGNQVLARIFRSRHHLIGWGLIIAAAWIFVNILFSTWYDSSMFRLFMPEDIFYEIRGLIHSMPALIIPVLCVIIGVKLIKGTSHNKPVYDEYTIPRERDENEYSTVPQNEHCCDGMHTESSSRSIQEERAAVERDPYWQGVVQIDEDYPVAETEEAPIDDLNDGQSDEPTDEFGEDSTERRDS